MPKIFTSLERKHIEQDLLSSASKCLRLYGVRKTTVDEIVSTAHIAKGTFYLFFDSKEDLFLTLLEEFISSLEDRYLEMLKELDENHIVTSLSEVFYKIADLFYKEGIFRLLDSENATLIKRKVSEEKYNALVGKIDSTYKSLFSYFSIDNGEDIERFKKAYKAILSLFLLDDEDFDEKTIRTLIRGLVLQLVE